MPALKYYDNGSGTYKYVVGGMNQASADARYLASGFVNVVRNGNMQIAQRGNGPWTGEGYTVDGWMLRFTGGTCSVTRTAVTTGMMPYLSVTISGQAGANYVSLWSIVENVNTLNGQQVTLSFMARATSGAPKITGELVQHFGSGGSPSGTVITTLSTVTLSTTMTRYTLTGFLPSTAGKVGGSGETISVSLSTCPEGL